MCWSHFTSGCEGVHRAKISAASNSALFCCDKMEHISNKYYDSLMRSINFPESPLFCSASETRTKDALKTTPENPLSEKLVKRETRERENSILDAEKPEKFYYELTSSSRKMCCNEFSLEFSPSKKISPLFSHFSLKLFVHFKTNIWMQFLLTLS